MDGSVEIGRMVEALLKSVENANINQIIALTPLPSFENRV